MTKKEKTKRIKKETYHTEEQEEVIRFVKILVIVIILVLVVYLFTRLFVTKDLLNNSTTEKEVTAGSVDYDAMIIGTMLSKSDDYYVILYNSEDLNSVYYSGLVNAYSNNDDALKVYTIDLSNELNKSYVTDNESEINLKTTDLSKFKVGNLALLKISNQKITKALTTEEEIAEELS
jgi:hypothetical protein